jgi:hypothetical protein
MKGTTLDNEHYGNKEQMNNTILINGTPAVAPKDAIAYKYADPTEDARWIYDEDDLRAIARDDPHLIVRVQTYAR